jgi:hypothetical protein
MKLSEVVQMAVGNANEAWDQIDGYKDAKGSYLVNVIDTLRENGAYNPENALLAVEVYLARWNRLQSGK